jgi:hypothetical protein
LSKKLRDTPDSYQTTATAASVLTPQRAAAAYN